MSFSELDVEFGFESPDFERKFLQRKNFLIKVGEHTARILSDLIFDLHGEPNAVAFNFASQYLDTIVRRYIEKVARFRLDNDFDEDHRINFSKIAGLLAVAILEADPETLFRFSTRAQRSAYPKLAGPIFVYRLATVILQFSVDKIDPMAERDLIYCFFRYPDIKADVEWIIYSLRMLQIAYGEKE
ncbi:MAG TPA: hypothetical protein VEB64_08620 [Azospirillaceae bacterium]|nr:hypothetical protein [Azospirillaceae bacterium]